MRFSRSGIAAWLLAVIAGAAFPADAQSRFVRPQSQPLGHSLVATGEISAGADRLSGTDRTTGEVLVDRTGSYARGLGGLRYDVHKGWVSGSASASSVARYFSAGADEIDVANYGQGNVRFEAPLSRRVSVNGAINASLQPVSALTLFPDLFSSTTVNLVPTDFDLGARLGRQLNISGELELAYALGRRTDLSFGGAYYRSGGIADIPTLENQRFGIRLRHTFNRFAAVRLGYGRDTGRRYLRGDETSPDVQQDIIDIGVDLGFSEDLAISRRTTFHFSTASVLISDQRSRRFDVVADAGLDHQFSRAWTGRVWYARSIGFVQVLAEPSFSDSVSAGIDGRLGRRLGLNVSSGFSKGGIGLSGPSNGYFAFQSSNILTFDLTRSLALAGGYTAYRYRFDNGSLLPNELGTSVTRHSLHIGTSISVPLVGNRSRRGYAAR